MWVDGQMTDRVPVSDRGLNYADGLFETMRIVDGAIPLIEDHLERLARDAARLRLPVPDRSALRRELGRAAADTSAGVLKLVLTRGSGGRGYAPPPAATCRRIISIHPLPEYPRAWYQRGVCVRICDTVLGTSPSTGGLKHLGRLEQVLASQEPADGAAEGLMRDVEGRIIEGIRSNLFLVQAQRLLTPDVRLSGVAGVMRGMIIELAPALGLEVEIAPVRSEDLMRAEELFLSSSVFGVWPVREIRGMRLLGSSPAPAGTGGSGARHPAVEPGSALACDTTRRIMRAIAALGVQQWAV